VTELTDNQQRILDVAAEGFMESGFDSTSIDDIARRLNQTKGVIYYSFRSKIEIFQAVYERGMLDLAEAVTKQAARPGTGRERLEWMAQAHVAALLERPAYHDAIRHGVEQRVKVSLTDEQRQKFTVLRAMRADYEGLFINVIEDGIADSSLNPVRPRLAARLLVGSLNAVNFWHSHHGPGDEDLTNNEFAATLAELLIGGLAATPATGRA
jgi:AcrR family transcriptional regulator